MRKVLTTVFILNVFIFSLTANSSIDSLRRLKLDDFPDSVRIEVYHKLMIRYRTVNVDSSLFYAQSVLTLGTQLDRIKSICSGLQGIGMTHWIKQDFDSALYYFSSAADRAVAAGDSLIASRYFGNMGSVYGIQGKHELALRYMFLRLRATERFNDMPGMSKAINNIMYIYHQREDYEQALIYARKDLALKLAEGDKLLIQDAYSNMAGVFTNTDMADSTLYYMKIAIQMAQELGRDDKLPVIYGNLAYFFNSSKNTDYKNLDSVKYYAEKQLEYAIKANQKNHEARAHGQIGGSYYYGTSNHKMALFHNQKAVKLYQELGLTREALTKMGHVAINFNDLGRFEEAYEALEKTKVIQDSIYQAENEKALQELKVEYETEQKEKELSLKNERIKVQSAELANQALVRNGAFIGLGVVLIIALLLYRNYLIKKKNSEAIAIKNEQLQKALNEREALLKEIHHRVKNNLQIIASLLYLQSDETENTSVKQLLEQGQGRVRSMALIHQKLYENDDLKSIPFQEYLNELIGEIQKSFGGSAKTVQLDVHAEGIFFDVETAVPLGLIINELSTNAFKYAFNTQLGGILQVHIRKNDDDYEMVLSDNGVGIPDEKLNDPTSTSLGLKLTKMLSEQIEGEYNFSNQGGTTFELKFSA